MIKLRKEKYTQITEEKSGNYMAIGIGLGMLFGASIGLLIGTIIDNIPLGAFLGSSIGTILGIVVAALVKSNKTIYSISTATTVC